MLILILSILAALSYTQGFPAPGKELIYNYNARIRVGTYEPLSFASQFILEGKLHLQHENKNSTLVRFTDLTYKLYNGELNNRNEHESISLALPEETVDLLRIFRIEYDENGLLSHLTTESGEPKYARNIKKSIASLLQLDQKNLQFDSNVPHAFITEERSIYGRGLEEYNVIPQDNEIIVQKMRDVKTSRHWYNYFGMNIEPQLNGISISSPISINSHRQYILNKNANEIQIKRLEAHGGIYFHLLRGLTDAQYVSVNQTLELLEIIPVETKYVINREDRTDQIDFHFEHDTQYGAIVDLTFGRNPIKQENIRQIILEVLEEALMYLQANQLEIEAPDAKKGQAINRLHRLMSQLDIPNLEQIYATLSERNTEERGQQILQIYQQILPLIGTRATVIFIRNLIRKNKIQDDLKIDMLNKLPFYLRMRNEKLLEEIEDLIDLGPDVNLEVRRAAVLCFASLVNKVYMHRIHNHEHHHINNEENMIFNYPGNWDMHTSHQNHLHEEHNHEQQNILLDRYILRFIKLLENAQDYETQLLYIQALHNIQIGNVSKYLEPYVSGIAPNSNRHLRFLAICASLAGDLQNPERVYRIYWPIFTDRNLHLEIRAAAYFAIMSTRPTMNKLWNIYWFLQTEKCPELYNFIYTHLQSLAAVKNPILNEFKINAQQILRYIRKPNRRYLSGNYIIDYKDPQYDFGGMLHAMLISTSTSKALYIDITNHILNVPLQLYSIYLKIEGLDRSISDKLLKDPVNRLNIEELNQLLRFILSIKEKQNIHVEYSLLQHNQVIRIGYYNQKNIKNLINQLQNLQIENIKCLQNALNIQYNLLSQLVLPNDLGFPTVIQLKAPRVTNNMFKISRENVNNIVNIHGDIKLQLSMQTMFDLGIYNPIPDVWQGVQRINSYDHVIPLNVNLAINTQQQSLKLTINNNQDIQKGAIGLRSHVRNIVYVFGGRSKNYLKQSNNRCNMVEEINRGIENRKEISLLDVEDENTGRRYEIKSFDTERKISQRSLLNLLKSLLQNGANINDQKEPISALLLSLRNIWCRIVLLPGIGRSGFIIRSIPSVKNPVSHIDVSFRYNNTINKEENSLSPSTRINTRATYAVKSLEEKILKTWDVNAIIDMNSGRTINNIKLQISKIVPEETDYRICIDGIQKWNLNHVSSDLSIAIGHSGDNKCAKEDAFIEINMEGKPFELPLDNIDECSSVHVYEPLLEQLQISHIHDIKCLQKHTDITNYVYNVKISKSSEYLWEKLRAITRFVTLYYDIHISQEQRQIPIQENEIRIVARYSQRNNDFNLQVERSQEIYNISGIDDSNLMLIEIKPYNYHFSKKILWLQQFGLVKSCVITQQRILNGNNHIIEKAASDDWIEYVRDFYENKIFSVAVKKIEEINKLGLRINFKGQNLEIIPKGEEYQITLNSEVLSMRENVGKNPYLQKAWFTIGVLDTLHQTLILRIPDYELYIELNGNHVKMDISQYASNLEGVCFEI